LTVMVHDPEKQGRFPLLVRRSVMQRRVAQDTTPRPAPQDSQAEPAVGSTAILTVMMMSRYQLIGGCLETATNNEDNN